MTGTICPFLAGCIKPSPYKSRYYVGLLRKEDVRLSDIERYSKIRWIKTESLEDSWVADPFIYKVKAESIQIFVEQFFQGKGRLVLLDVSLSTMEILCAKVILQLDTHLSFPYIWREGETLFIMPENVENGNLRIWKFNESTSHLEDPQVLIDVPLEDAQLCKIGNQYFIMGVRYVHNDYFDCTRNLEIYKADSLFGRYQHIQTIHNPLRLERGAGTVWQEGDTFIRPAQNCEDGYGTSLLFYRMKFEADRFSETLEFEYRPDKEHPRSRAFHTYNEKDGYVVIDGNALVHPHWSKFFFSVKKKIGL